MPRRRVRKSTESAQTRASNTVKMTRAVIGLAILGAVFLLSQPGILGSLVDILPNPATHGGITNGDAELATLFTPEVLFWEADIRRWARERRLNPNLIATIIQIESCGDPQISSPAGAQGLFQVMPFHFDDDENQLNPENNARNGMDHLVDCLVRADYDVGVAFACYNGGASVINLPQSEWFEESRSYYRWGTGIYNDAAQGKASSQRLNEWLAAGGSALCQRAQATQSFYMP